MKISKSLLMLLTLATLNLIAQETYNTNNLIVTKGELESNNYKNDTTAHAFFIYEKGYSRIENGRNYDLLTDYEAKIKILDKQGFNRAIISIYLYNNDKNREKLRNIKAYTYNIENDAIVKTLVREEEIYTERIDENYSVVKFTFPNVKAGSILAYSYQMESPFVFKFNGWEFQDEIPKVHSEFIADLPGNYVYNIRLIGNQKLSKNENSLKKRCLQSDYLGTADCAHSEYVMKDVPAYIEEDYMTTKYNYLSRIEYELKEFKGFDGVNKKFTETWKNVDDRLKKELHFGIQLKKIKNAEEILPDSTKLKTISIDKAKEIYSFITNQLAWNGEYQLLRDVPGNEIKNVIKTKTGNVSGINILLHNSLKSQGFDVQPVILSTRKNGYVTTIHPVITDFNYVIVNLKFNDEDYFLDATGKNLAFGELPFRCLNKYGRLLDFNNESKWISLKPSKRTSMYFKDHLIINKDLSITKESKYVFTGYNALDMRNKLSQSNELEFTKQWKKNNPELQIENIEINNSDNPSKPLEIKLKSTDRLDEIADIIFLKPFLSPFFKENPFKLNQRTYPVDFGHSNHYNYVTSINIPENYTFTEIPDSKSFALPDKLGFISIKFQVEDDKMIVSHRVSINTEYFSPDYYGALKEFYSKIVEIENDTTITIEKKS